MPQVPDERPQPDEVPFREVEHEEPPDPDAWPWEVGRYPVGHVLGTAWWGGKADSDRWRRDMRRKEKSREGLGGFGFRRTG